jgi:hypothetical protein
MGAGSGWEHPAVSIGVISGRSMKSLFTQLFHEDSEPAPKSSRPSLKQKQYGDDALLIFSSLPAVLAMVGIGGLASGELATIARYALAYAIILAPATFGVCLIDIWKSGVNWSRAVALLLSVSVVALGVIVTHDMLSTTPFLLNH